MPLDYSRKKSKNHGVMHQHKNKWELLLIQILLYSQLKIIMKTPINAKFV